METSAFFEYLALTSVCIGLIHCLGLLYPLVLLNVYASAAESLPTET